MGRLTARGDVDEIGVSFDDLFLVVYHLVASKPYLWVRSCIVDCLLAHEQLLQINEATEECRQLVVLRAK